MKTRRLSSGMAICLSLGGWAASQPAQSQTAPQFSGVQRSGGQEIALTLSGAPGSYYRIGTATNLGQWSGLVTIASGTATSLQGTDAAAPFLEARYYRAEQLPGTNIFVGDHLSTTNGDVLIQPHNHATSLLNWQGKTIYVDPTNSPAQRGVHAGVKKAISYHSRVRAACEMIKHRQPSRPQERTTFPSY